MNARRITFQVLALGLLGVLVAATAVFACTGAATRYDISPAKVAISSQQSVRVTGENFGSTTPVEIRWNTADGPIVGTAPSPNFAVDVQIPADAEPGVHYLVASQRDAAGTVSYKVSEVIEVTGSKASAKSQSGRSASQDLWSSYSPGSTDLASTPQLGSSNQSGSSLAGIALAGVGLVTLLSVSVMALATRRGKRKVV